MKIFIAIAASMIATGALAQPAATPMATTPPAPMENHDMGKMTAEHHEMKTTRHHEMRHETRAAGDTRRHYRKCHTRMHHGHKTRVCRTVHR